MSRYGPTYLKPRRRFKRDVVSTYEGIGLSNAKIHHVLQVARNMYRISSELFGWSEAKCREMFVLGLVHNCGYEFAFTQEEHSSVGGDMLADCRFKYSNEVYWHGKVTPPYRSDELLVLNIADMITSKNGDTIKVSERLRDIRNRYGKNSSQYVDAMYLVGDISLTLGKNVRYSKLLREMWDC